LLPVYYPRTTTIRRRRRRRKYGIGVVSASATASSSNGGLEPFTERAIKAIMYSQREAKALGREMVFPQHLLLGLISEDEEHHLHHHYLYEQQGFLGSNITLHMARDAVRNIWHHHPPHPTASNSSTSTSSAALPFSLSSKRVFEAALHYSRTMAHHFIAPEHISIALFTVDDGSATRLLYRLGANVNQLAAVAIFRLQEELAKDAQFCVDLTARASGGLMDPVIGRENELQRIIQILCRRTKNNPILLGESGVGKTAIAEGLALNIAQANVPIFLLKKRIMSLDIALLMAGAKERGELEARVTKLVEEVMKAGDVILFIDEVHILVGRGNRGSGLDIAELLKPSLGRGQLQCIASTTIDEYRMHFEKDKALARRFQPVWINEPSQDDAVRILLGLSEKYEAHHNCRFTLEAINAAVYLSAKYISDRYLPDKAIDLIDEAGSRARIEAFKRKRKQQTCILSKSPDEYWQEIRTVQAMHELVLASKQYEGDYSLDDTIDLVSKFSLPSTSDANEPSIVGPDDIAAVASLWSGIQVQQLTDNERMLLLGLDEQLRRRVVGQDEAVSTLSRAVKRFWAGLKDPKRPIAEQAMIRLDMSEYMERHSVSKLIGSPPGYVGFGEGGTLTEAIRRRPFTVILLDEIEKAHPAIFNILLQLFEDGHLTDSQGRRVSFKNAIVVMTSNVGSTAISMGRKGSMAFFTADDKSTSYAGMKEIVMKELKTYFRPELLNRIDEVVVFRPLEKAQMLEIYNVMLEEVKHRLISQGICLEVSESVKNLVCQRGYDKTSGARALRRAISLIIEDVLSEAILYGDYSPGDTALIDLDASGNPFVTHHVSDSAPML
ncbi:chaperone protein clpd, partial [Quercus suber]